MYLHRWSRSGFRGMISDFEGIVFYADSTPLEDGDSKQNGGSSLLVTPSPKDGPLLESLNYSANSKKWKISKVLLATYYLANSRGCAYVLFKGISGEIFEVDVSHGVGDSLENRWNPKEVTVDAVTQRVCFGGLGKIGEKDYFSENLLEILGEIS